MTETPNIRLEPFAETQEFRGIMFPKGPKYRQFIVTGPPGSGKTTLMGRLKGWPMEGYVDLTLANWWRSEALAIRPREVHLGMPYKGVDEALTVFDKPWLEADVPLELELDRVVLPPERQWSLQRDWRRSFIFEFMLPDPEMAFQWRQARVEKGLFPVDFKLTLDQVERQNADYLKVAACFHRMGMAVYVRKQIEKTPYRLILDEDEGLHPILQSRPEDPSRAAGVIGKLLASSPFRSSGGLGLESEWQTFHGEIRLGEADGPVRLRAGDETFILMQEEAVFPGERRARLRDWLIVPPDYGRGPIRGFVRLRPGESFVLAPDDKMTRRYLQVSSAEYWPKIRFQNANGQLVFYAPEEGESFSLSLADDDGQDVAGRGARIERLKHVGEIFGGPLCALEGEAAIDLAVHMLEILKNECYRPLDSGGQPGAILEIPPRLTPIVIGDLHAQIDNLLRVLSTNSYLDALEADEACLIFVGDIVHEEEPDKLHDMSASILMLDLVFRLKAQFPRNVFLLRGNHETFDADVSKGGVPQGLVMEKAVCDIRGETYKDLLAQIFENLPYIAKSEDYVVVHAAPTRSQHEYEVLVDLRRFPGIAHEITWNRMKRPGYPAGYTQGDVKRFRRSLGVVKKTPVIVGHTPFNREGTTWTNIGRAKGHHVVYSARQDWVGLFTRLNGRMVPLEYKTEPLLAPLNTLITEDVDSEGPLV